MSNKIKCPKCGHMNEPGESHCSSCGYQLGATKKASSTWFMQSMYKAAMSCPTAAGDVDLNTKNRDKTIEKHNYGPLNLSDDGYWELVADKWKTTPEVAKKSKCGNCVAFDISPRMDDCMPGPVSDGEGHLGYCWMHHFKCHSARTCTTWAKGGPIKGDEDSHDWQKKAKPMKKEAEDSSVKSDILKAFKAEGGALGMKALKKHVKSGELQAKLKELADEGRVYKHRHGDLIEKNARVYRGMFSGAVDVSGRLAEIANKTGKTAKTVTKRTASKTPMSPDTVAFLKKYKPNSDLLKQANDNSSAYMPKKQELSAAGITLADWHKLKKKHKVTAKHLTTEMQQATGAPGVSKGYAALDAYIGEGVKYLRGHEKQHGYSTGTFTKRAEKGEYDDSHMLSKVLGRMSAQSAHLKEKIDSGLILPSWAEYKLYNAYSGLGKALGTAYPGEYEKDAAATATKTDPAKWEAAKREAKSKMGGKHSARAMQLATQIYKKKGGGYSGSKPTSKNNSLKKWTKQKWGYSGKDKPGQGGSGVYLPKRRRDALKSSKEGKKLLAAATRRKHSATAKGQQYSSHGLAAGTSLKKAASSSRVKSPDAYYQPQMTMPNQPMPMQNSGNSDIVNQQAQQVAMANKNNTQESATAPPAPAPSIQQNTPMVPKPFSPKYSGM